MKMGAMQSSGEKMKRRQAGFVFCCCLLAALLVLPVSGRVPDANTDVYAAATTRHTAILLISVLESGTRKPISGARVMLLDQKGKEVGLIGTTDDKGVVEPYEIASGNYKLQAEKDEYVKNTVEVTVQSAIERKVEILLSRPGSGGDGGTTGPTNPINPVDPTGGGGNPGGAGENPTDGGDSGSGGSGTLPRTGGAWNMSFYVVAFLLNSALLVYLIIRCRCEAMENRR